ncbi:MAG: cyclic nucleotide-binding domain-containing protein [Desulfomonilaceae bacterium]|nr:cyclic nucleotide-binding domain-containing protein [Desulfomonilaceae bacterium]
MKRFLEKYLKIYVHESSRFLWLASIFFVIFFVTAIFRTYVDAAFLKRYGPQYIPWMLVINALMTFVVFAVAERLGRRFVDHVLLSGFLMVYAASVIILFFMVTADISIAYPILYQLLYLLDSVLLVYLWNIAGDLFDTRQGKRIFPMVTSSQVLGTTLGSFATKPITLLIGEDPTLILFGVVCLVTALYLAKTGAQVVGHAVPKAATAKSASRKLTEVPGLMAKYPIIRYLIITGIAPNLLLPIFFYQFSIIANNTFTSEQSLISFLSIFRGITTLTTFVLLFFVGRMYQSIGLTNSSLVHPINFSLIFASLTAFFNIYVACYGQFTVILIQRAIAGPVNKVLFNVIPADLAVWSRTFVRGTVLKIGMLTGSILMIVLKPVLSAQYFSVIAFAVAVYWVIETLIFRKHYKRILKQVIVEKQIDFDQVESVRTFDSGGAAMELGPVSVEDRKEERAPAAARMLPEMEPEVALKLLDDPNPSTRAEAAAAFIANKDIRAVAKLVRCLEDTDGDVREAAMEALMGYQEKILPFLEASLVEARPRTKQGILEVIRLAGLKEFEMIPFLGKELEQAYANLVAIRRLDAMEPTESVKLLKQHLKELNEETLSLIFYALWVSVADMRLMYLALKSETASIAIELVENSISKEMSPYLIPLIEDVPLNEKIEKGKSVFPLIRKETDERVLTYLAGSQDPVARMLALFVMAEIRDGNTYVPIIETLLNDEFGYVRELADYAMKRTMNEVVDMPDVISRINTLKDFGIFDGMGIRELHAIASVVNVETFKPGDVMIREGEENSSIYLVVTGKVTIFTGFGTETQKEKVTIGSGSFLGELSLFTRLAPNATCVAAEETVAYVLRHHQFQEIMRVYPQIGINLCRFFTMKLRQTSY